MASLEVVRGELTDAHRDTRLNLQSVLENNSLTPEQRWGVAVGSAFAARNERLKEAVLHEARQALGEKAEPVIEDARAAASLMGMNNVYYRFRHMVGKESYSTKRAGLRMNRLVQVLTNKVDFELVCLAVSAINGCETCVQSHEKVVIEGGLSEDQVHDAVRIASVIHAAAVGLES
ncbi:carboxymuconolactone decarboxylase family protein [Archangium violaceum]|uniref:carboxymuconolactone decarboxylase family protein n=1 Tax=Archangium TaxID=47 RepID=UPI000937C042|nr:carboxymuconolactone decarboxylase family protein [Archangium sp. Cb G35]OJT18477.1 alkyl hydroperoxide reductase [Archangium sp. Cb G35]WNG55657.1 alkyl hydroperoxide reductase [Archangium gephyra]WPB74699.1 carboxymuconolactone decarboxylase family protein [Archangium gephyra]